VTDSTVQIHVYSASGGDTLWEHESVAGRDLLCLVDPKVSGYACPAPRAAPEGKPQVVRIRPNTFHVGGLYPSGEMAPRFVVPCVFSKTGWVRRQLTVRERCWVYDIGAEMIDSLSEDEMMKACKGNLIPGRVALKVLDLFSLNSKDVERVEEDGDPSIVRTPKRARVDCGITGEKGYLPETAKLDKPGTGEVGKQRATKSDDAEVPEYLWNEVLVPDREPDKVEKVAVLRSFALRWVKRKLLHCFLKWFSEQYPHVRKWKAKSARLEAAEWLRGLFSVIGKVNEAVRDWTAGRDCIHRFAESTWWEWPAGSRPHFWRWPLEHRHAIRDGVTPWLSCPQPRWLVPQRNEKDPNLRAAMRKKLDKIRKLGYIRPGEVKSLTSFFSVPKGDNDIRMVYDGTKSGLNDAMWAPWFALPTIETHLRAVGQGTFMGDLDIGDMFHNFVLHDSVQRLAGIDLTCFYPEELHEGLRVIWERWERCAMGLRSSPYNAVQATLFAEELIRGSATLSMNVFRWDHVRLNLPGSKDYEPHLPWVSKVRAEDGKIANDFVTYVDDTRTCGNSWSEARQASRVVASKLNWLGIQDAARKRRDPCQDPGPWAGSVVQVSPEGAVTVSATQERWEKTRNIVEWIAGAIADSDTIEFKTLEKHRGFLVYVGRTYPVLVPYLKGIHLSLDSWRPWRKEDGWKLTQAEIKQAMSEKESHQYVEDQKTPTRVRWVPRLQEDIKALLLFTSSRQPPKRAVRPIKGTSVVYTFGDASGSGFGVSTYENEELRFYSGQWENSYSALSSNFRELANLVIRLESDFAEGLLNGTEIFIFTDNSTAEAAYFKGTSKSRLLFELILRLQFVHLHAGITLHFVHVAGKRMIAQGTDGLSRGGSFAAVMQREDFLVHIPLNLGVMDRQPVEMKGWVDSWFQGQQESLWLTPENWYLEGQTQDWCIWTPPPAAADAALEQLAKSTHKRPNHTHLVLIPRLMTALWRKLLHKICDVVFAIPPGTDMWCDSQCEPVIVGLYLSLSRHSPWRLKRTKLVAGLESQLHGLSKDDYQRSGFILRQFLQQARSLERMSSGMVRKVLQGTG